MITVIEQSTQERKQEIIDIFNQIRPLLDEGHSYLSALNTIDPSIARSRQSKEIINYGETQGYSRSNFSRRTQYLNRTNKVGNKNKYGLLNVTLSKNKSYLTGYIWGYKYIQEGIPRTITRTDLIKLRKEVENRGLEWKVIDLEKAKKSYEMNRIMQENARHNMNPNTTGIYRVSKGHCPRCKQGFTWQYVNKSKGKEIYLSSISLETLKEKVLEIGEEWIILDEEKARKLFEGE